MSRTQGTNFGVVARLRGNPGQADELRRRLHVLTGLTRRENGCLSCEMIENGCDSTEFTLLAKWSSEEAHDAHFGAAPIQGALFSLSGLLSGELDPDKRALSTSAVRYGTNSYGSATR